MIQLVNQHNKSRYYETLCLLSMRYWHEQNKLIYGTNNKENNIGSKMYKTQNKKTNMIKWRDCQVVDSKGPVMVKIEK